MLPNRPPRSGLETNNPSLHQSQGGSVAEVPFALPSAEDEMKLGAPVETKRDRITWFGLRYAPTHGFGIRVRHH